MPRCTAFPSFLRSKCGPVVKFFPMDVSGSDVGHFQVWPMKLRIEDGGLSCKYSGGPSVLDYRVIDHDTHSRHDNLKLMAIAKMVAYTISPQIPQG